MFEEFAPKVQPSPDIYSKANEEVFNQRLVDHAESLSAARSVISDFEVSDTDSRAAAIAEEMAEDDEFNAFNDELFGGTDSGRRILARLFVGDKDVSAEHYEDAQQSQAEASYELICMLVGYQGYIKQNLIEHAGYSTDEAHEEAWLVAWKKLRKVLSNAPGTLLAETALHIDQQIRATYGPQYLAMEKDRGPIVNQDVEARTFYEVMQDHTHRAIIGAARDDWTGLK